MKKINMKLSKFIKDLFTTGFTQIISSLLVIILLKIMALSLSEEYFGIFMVIRKIIGIGAPLITLNLGVGLARYISYEKEKEKEFLNISLLVIIFFSLVVMAIFYIFKNYLSQIFFNTSEYNIFILFTALFLFGHAIYSISYTFFRGKQEINKSNKINIFSNFFSIILALTLWKIFGNQYSKILYFYLLLFPIFMIVLGMGYLWHNIIFASLSKIKEKLQLTKQFFSYSLSRIPSGIFLALIFGIPVFVASHKISVMEAGYIGIAISTVRLIQIFATPFNLLFLPKFGEIKRRNNSKEINQKVSIVVNFIITVVPFLAIICYGLAKYIVFIFFGTKYIAAVQSTSIVILFSAFYISYVLTRGILDGLYSFPYVNIICMAGFLVTTVTSFLFYKNIFILAIDFSLGLFVIGIMALYILIKKTMISLRIKELLISLFYMASIFVVLFFLDNWVEFMIFKKYYKFGIMVAYRIILVMSLFWFYWKPKTLWYKELKYRIVI
jgi:O-antigen/teichoic acid export membrane protein